jgi:anti-sigma-K factor RskA
VRDEERVSAGLMGTDDDGRIRAPLAVALADGDVVAVTVEPEGGSEEPTSPIVLSAAV